MNVGINPGRCGQLSSDVSSAGRDALKCQFQFFLLVEYVICNPLREGLQQGLQQAWPINHRLNTGRRAAGQRHAGADGDGGGRNQMLLGRPLAVRLYTLSPCASCLWASSRLESTLRWHRLHVIERLPIRPGATGGALASFRRA